MVKRSYAAGAKIFSFGDAGDELCVIRRGEVRIVLQIDASYSHHLSTFGRGGFFGEMSLPDGARHSADALAASETELFLLSRKAFDTLADEHKKVAMKLLEGVASALSSRLSYANAEIRALEWGRKYLPVQGARQESRDASATSARRNGRH